MYRKEIISYLISIALIFLACLLHFLDFYDYIGFPVHALVFILYTFVIFLWMRNMKNRVLRSYVSARFKLIGLLLIFYLSVRTVKYVFFIENQAAVDFIRYLYLVFPLVLIQLVFLTSLYVGKSERERISKFWYLLLLPTFIFVILIISNNYHGLVFSLDPSLRGLSMYGPVYYFVLIYIGLFSLMTIGFTMFYSYKRSQLKAAKLPIFIILLWAVYTFLYMTAWEPFEYFKIIFKSAEFNILMVILFIESLVFMRLLPSNRSYEKILALSSLNIGIMDLRDKMVFRPKIHKDIGPKLIYQALEAPVLIDEDTLLESARIKGGKTFWFVDLKAFNMLKKELLTLNEDMLNENELLKAKTALKENMVQVEEQREIREHIQKKLKPQFNQLKNILMNLPEDEDLFEVKLKHACFINVYIKRYANLFLLTKNKETLDLAELKLAFNESLDYLKLSQVKTSLDWILTGKYDAKVCIDFYEFFQYALEFYLPGIDSLTISAFRKNRAPELEITITGAKANSFLDAYGQAYVNDGIRIHESIGENEIILGLSLEGRTL